MSVGWLIGGILAALLSLAWIGGVSAEVVRGKTKIASGAFIGAIALHAGTGFASVWMFYAAWS